MGRDSEAHCSSKAGKLAAGSVSICTMAEITSRCSQEGNTG